MISFITNYIYFGIINLISKKKIIVCDIDNTIAQSVDSYGCNLSFSERKIILELVRFVKSKIKEDYYLYFFTVRPLSEYNTTLFWLRNNGFGDIKFFQLFMARNPMQKVNLYKSCDVKLFASTCENLPNILLEGMRTGLPIVCSNYNPMPEILGEGAVYFDPNLEESIISAIRKVYTSSELRAKISKESYSRSLAYSWKKCALQTFNYLESFNKECKCAE